MCSDSISNCITHITLTSLKSKPPRQIHHPLRIHRSLHRSQPRRIRTPVKLSTAIRRQRIIRISRQIRVIDALTLRNRRQSIHTLLHLAPPKRVFRRILPGKVQIQW